MPCYSPLKGFRNKETGGITFRRSSIAGEEMEVSCGQCLGCRLDHSRTWGFRIIHEASLWDDNCFVTLTYRPIQHCTPEQLECGLHEPADGSLVKSHYQKFMKRLRRWVFSKKGLGRIAQYEVDQAGDKRLVNGVRYYQCGEYGDQLYRPHYHACLFNLQFPDKQLFKECDGYSLFTSQTLDDLWGYGFCTIGELTLEAAMYCARYCTKKVTGTKAHDHYLRVNLETGECYWVEPEYSTMSRRPGIGSKWYQRHKADFFPSDDCYVPGHGNYKKVPRYYTELLRSESEEEFEFVKARRQEFREAHAEEYTSARLFEKYRVKKDQIRSLTRRYENES